MSVIRANAWTGRPDDEGRLLEEVGRGQQASDLLANPLLAEAFTAVERGYVTAWAENRSPEGQDMRLGPEGRERLWNAVQALRAVRNALETHVRTGEMARRQIEDAAGVKRGLFGR